jgi:hypothetical protein
MKKLVQFFFGKFLGLKAYKVPFLNQIVPIKKRLIGTLTGSYVNDSITLFRITNANKDALSLYVTLTSTTSLAKLFASC